MQQERVSENAIFVTLTYRDTCLPEPRIFDGKPIFDVSKDDVRLYHYRLRKALGIKSKKLKYFLVSEYGPNPENGWLYRPHYHVIYFNLAKEDEYLIQDCWKKGFVEIGPITEGRVRYVSGYCTEKLFVPTGAAPSFTFISNGIGQDYVSSVGSKFNDSKRAFVPMFGKRYPMPRYYKEQLLSAAERKLLEKTCQDRAEKTYQAHLDHFEGDHDKLQEYYHEMRADFVRKLIKKHKKKQNPNGTH